MRSRSALIVFALTLVGCNNADMASGQATRTDSAGVEIVLNKGPDQALDWRFERVLDLGGDDDGNHAFFNVREEGVGFGSRGEILVLDAGNRRVQVFDSSGVFLKSVGRQGQGPGEFQNPASLVAIPNGGILVFDIQRRVAMRFDSLGTFLGQTSAPRSFLGGRIRVNGGDLLYSTRSLDRESGERRFHVTRASLADTLDLAVIPLPKHADVRYEECGIASISLSPVFANSPSWDGRGVRSVVSEGPEYRVRVYESGSEVRHIRRALEPEVATREMAILDLGEGAKWQVGSGPECVVAPEVVVEKRGVASHVPLVSRLTISGEGDLWVQRKLINRNGGPIDVFDRSGEYSGTLPAGTPWPSDFGPDTRIVVLEEDELGLQRVVVYRVHRE